MDRRPGTDDIARFPSAGPADAFAHRATPLPPLPRITRARGRRRRDDISREAFDTPARRARIETRAFFDARVSNASKRLRAPSRPAARAHPRSPPSHAPNQQQDHWVTEPYLLSCFAHFGACVSFFRFRTVRDSRNVPDTRVTSTVFSLCSPFPSETRRFALEPTNRPTRARKRTPRFARFFSSPLSPLAPRRLRAEPRARAPRHAASNPATRT